MPFNSISFIVFFALFAGAYFSIDDKKKLFLLIAGSWFFYSFANAFNLVHLLLTTIITYFFAAKINKEVNSKRFLIPGIFLILLQLIFAKYLTAFANPFSVIVSSPDKFFNFFILPIGISFYSLQAIGLLADVSSRKYQGKLNFKDVSLFLSFFPQSVSGPIHRANELLPQFSVQNRIQVGNIVVGVKTMLWGYFCKLIIADKISILTTPIFNTYFEQDGLSITIASLLFSLQIYFDFWGYSLIAIGAAKILGFSININFNAPYSVASFKEFWHRWHITLSKWMRDYVYIPLGGRKQKKYILFCLSIFITFLVSGFWHGITLNFILWGTTHAFFYLAEDFIERKSSTVPFFQKPLFRTRFISLFKLILFFVLISFTWLIFRAENFSELIETLKKIISVSTWSLANASKNYLTVTNAIYIVIILLTLLFSQSTFLKQKTEAIPTTTFETITDSLFVCICITTIILLGDIGSQEFLYFRF